MRILVAAAGSRGDVAPYTGLGSALHQAGHHVTIATTDAFAPLVQDAGLDFRALPGRPEPHGDVSDRRELMRAAAAFVTELGQGFVEALDPDTDLLLLSATTAPLGWHLAEATGVRTAGAYVVPAHPTGDFPPVVMGRRSLGRLGNRATGRFALRMADRVYRQGVAGLRDRLGLPPLPPAAMRRRQEEADWPVLYGFSTALVPRPADWRPGLDVVGTWSPYVAPDAALSTELEDFLAVGARPVFVGFGSMAGADAERLGGIAVRALRRAGLRGVLQLGPEGLKDDDILTVGDVPHALLFPRTAAVVHHGGAGTTAAALRAGVPAVPVPVAADQPFWAGRLAALGAATAPIPFASLTEERLAEALRDVVRRQTYARAAAVAARRMATEDGTGAVLKALG
ncbi:Sterol 3-beta-glucosyltransferase [Streptomyces davaonensis JCM 4913]|uniref:Sterol 3-beta-glucosyltransferase n=1 Tax=Streptomyces davaonensis (strain DSM 101723 / JCM 4913 / KCC S-0913 / 768) TaxID=1214101 RepID=K4QSX0_STRDJ|nr:glycosyltransferase [Streptomyces davaonensis]CCK25386.1 Sterol 3-beta-glucosyltransferase [Streptomyces davaonensis JCM 4913]